MDIGRITFGPATNQLHLQENLDESLGAGQEELLFLAQMVADRTKQIRIKEIMVCRDLFEVNSDPWKMLNDHLDAVMKE